MRPEVRVGRATVKKFALFSGMRTPIPDAWLVYTGLCLNYPFQKITKLRNRLEVVFLFTTLLATLVYTRVSARSSQRIEISMPELATSGGNATVRKRGYRAARSKAVLFLITKLALDWN